MAHMRAKTAARAPALHCKPDFHVEEACDGGGGHLARRQGPGSTLLAAIDSAGSPWSEPPALFVLLAATERLESATGYWREKDL